ncbi:biotin transporter BioY [Propioniciclava flava]
MLGAPVFANGHSGVAFPTFGYLIGYVIAAWVVGATRPPSSR